MEQLIQVELYSDGGANPNPGPGGYGVILSCAGIKKEFLQGFTCTTNNRMELLGVITGLSKLTKRSKVQVYTDSQYTINGIQKGWAKKWKANNWMRTKSDKAINYDLWEKLLLEVEKHEVGFTWVKGHNGHIENERCDELATQAMKMEDLLVDDFYMDNYYSKQESLLNSNLTPSPSALQERRISSQVMKVIGKGDSSLKVEKHGDPCKKCLTPVVKKIPKHTKKTLLKKFYYKYYFNCPNCKTNYMTNDAKDDVKNLKL